MCSATACCLCSCALAIDRGCLRWNLVLGLCAWSLLAAPVFCNQPAPISAQIWFQSAVMSKMLAHFCFYSRWKSQHKYSCPKCCPALPCPMLPCAALPCPHPDMCVFRVGWSWHQAMWSLLTPTTWSTPVFQASLEPLHRNCESAGGLQSGLFPMHTPLCHCVHDCPATSLWPGLCLSLIWTTCWGL